MSIRFNEELDPNEGPGFGCFIWQAVLFAVILLLIPVGVFVLSWPVWVLGVLMFIDLFLLFFVSMTAVFLLRVFFAGRRSTRRGLGPSAPARVIRTGGGGEGNRESAHPEGSMRDGEGGEQR
jgi:hypothetical protein